MTEVRRAGVMGSPIGHSLSPALHRAAYAELGLDGWSYDREEVDEVGLPAALDRLGPEWAGVSLTMPLKQAVRRLLDEESETARAVGAVNTVTFRDGRRIGDNTDVEGIVCALAAAGAESAAEAVVLGGGATAASALAALARLGVVEPVVVVRAPERASELLAAAERLGVRPRLMGWSDAADAVRRAPVVVSTVPAGAADPFAVELGPSDGEPSQGVSGVLLDVVYRPWPTRLAAGWEHAGGVAVPGLEMLVHQAVAQVRIWSGRSPDPDPMRAAGLAESTRSTQLAEERQGRAVSGR